MKLNFFVAELSNYQSKHSGTAKFKSIMDKFKLSQVQWSLLANLEPKDSVQTFVNPKYSAKDFTFIKEVLKKQWPQDTVKV